MHATASSEVTTSVLTTTSSSPIPSPTQASDHSPKRTPSPGEIAGIVVGSIVAVAALVSGFWAWISRDKRRSKKERRHHDSKQSHGDASVIGSVVKSPRTASIHPSAYQGSIGHRPTDDGFPEDEASDYTRGSANRNPLIWCLPDRRVLR